MMTGMKVKHRGHEISVSREKSMTGEMLVFWSIFRESDGYECGSGFSYDCGELKDHVKSLRETIDEELQKPDPWDEKGAENQYGK